MKELLEQVLRRLPAYAGQLLALVAEPRRFLSRQDLEADGALADALVFFGVSLAIALVAQLPLLTGSPDVLTNWAVRAAITFLSLLVTVAVLQLCWRTVGGKGSLKATFLLSCYIVSAATLLFLVFVLAAEGLFRLIDPIRHRQFHGGELYGFDSAGFIAYAGMLMIGLIVVSAWAFFAWSAYRRAHAVSRTRSGLALLLFNTVGLVVLFITVPMAAVLEPPPVQANKPALPPEIVGHWRAISQNPPSLSIADYDFTANGYYSYAHSQVSQEGECKVIRRRFGYGRVSLKEARMTLSPQVSKTDTQNTCTGKNAEATAENVEETYFYRLDRRPEGWSLCLEGRDGTLCLGPAPPLK